MEVVGDFDWLTLRLDERMCCKRICGPWKALYYSVIAGSDYPSVKLGVFKHLPAPGEEPRRIPHGDKQIQLVHRLLLHFHLPVALSEQLVQFGFRRRGQMAAAFGRTGQDLVGYLVTHDTR